MRSDPVGPAYRTGHRRRGLGILAVAATIPLLAGCAGAPGIAAESSEVISEGREYHDVPGLPDEALKTMNLPQYASGKWSIFAQDLDSGETVIDLNGGRMAEPGSFTKTYSVGAAWTKWGPDHTITTPVKQSGTVTDGTLTGDLVLVGQGDLTMGGRTKDDGTVDFTNLDHNDANPLPGATLTREDPLTGLDNLAAQVKKAGINAVAGDVVIDDRLFAGELDGEPITPILVNQNLLDVLITPGTQGEQSSAALTPVVAPWRLVSEVVTVAAGEKTLIDTPEISPDDPSTIVVRGSIAADSDPVLKVFVLEDPATFARTAFIEALQRAGVAVSADLTAPNPQGSLADRAAVDALPSVAELESLPLKEEATYVMKVSYNRGAQTLVCRLAAEAGDPGCESGMSVLQDIWEEAGLDTTGAALVDGSGLDGNFITPENAVQIQTIMAERPDAELWRDTLPILGVDGSLADVQSDSPAAGNVFAKTGTLLGWDAFNKRYRLTTKTLGGIMHTAKDRRLAFTIIMNQGFTDDIAGVFSANDDVGAVAAAIQEAY